jgi:hypothetical protein
VDVSASDVIEDQKPAAACLDQICDLGHDLGELKRTHLSDAFAEAARHPSPCRGGAARLFDAARGKCATTSSTARRSSVLRGQPQLASASVM